MERWQKPEPDNPSPADGASSSSLDYSAPLRSARSNATSPAPCRFYKLSAELSRESLRIPGAVPFLWEQSPGQCKDNIIMQNPASASPTAADLAKRSLANLLRQSERESGLPEPSSPSDLQATPSLPISQPPSMDRPRGSSARHSSLPPPASSSIAIAEALSDSVSDAFTATAGGASVDDSLLLSGPLRPATTPSEARDFIMHRFLPAAQTIACESPQTPSRRFLPTAGSAPPAACCGGSFRDYCGAACAESAAVNGPSFQAGNSSVYASPSAIPAWRSQVPEGSFHSAIAEFDDVPTEDDDDEPPLRPRSCGFFPFRIRISIRSTRSKTRSSASSKHSHQKKQQSDKIGGKSVGHSRTPKRLMDILCEDDGEFPVQGEHSRNVGAERERNRVAALKQSPMPSYGSPCSRPFYSSDHYCRDNPRHHQNCAWWPSDSNVDEAEDCRLSFYDTTSRFCSPSPAALHGANVRASHENHLSALNAGPPGTRSCAGSMNGSPHSALTCGMDPHFCNYGLCCCSAHITRNSIPASYQTQISSPSSCLTPSSLLSSSQDSFFKQDMATVNNAGLDAFSRIRRSEQQACIVHNALCQHDDEDKLLSQLSPLTSDGKGVKHGIKYESQGREEHADATCDINESKIAENFASSDENTASNVAHNMHEGHLHQFENVITGDSHRYEKIFTNHMNGGNICACDLTHCTHNCHISYLQKASPHPYHAAHHLCNCNPNVHVHASAISSEKTGDAHERQTGGRKFPRSRMAPPLPKSPTHSWLDKTMPLVASAASKCTNKSSRFSDTPTIKAAAEPKHKQAPPATARHSKWEALVKGSQIQPGHLGLSKELFHPSQTTTYTVS